MRAQRYVLVFDAIRSILETSGVANLTISNIAKISQLHPNTINYYFNGKIDMLMRFYTYMSDNERRELPDAYTHIPPSHDDAVRSFLQLIDFELFAAANRPHSFQKIIVYLYGMMDIHPQVKYYLEEQQEQRYAFLRTVLAQYCDAGIVRPDRLEEGLSSLVMLETGYTVIFEYYNTPQMLRSLACERARLARLLISPRAEKYLDRYIPSQSLLMRT